MEEAYDDILIAYGFKIPVLELALCNRFVYVTDLFQYNLEQIINLSYDNKLMGDTKTALLIKDMIEIKISRRW